MKRMGLGCLALVALALVVALCFGVFDDDEVEIEVDEVGITEVAGPWLISGSSPYLAR